MRATVALCVALATWCACQPAWAAFIVQGLGSHNQSASASNQIPSTSVDCPPGSTVAVFASYVNTADTLSSVTDGAGNTYQMPIDNTTGTGVGIGVAYAYNIPNDLPIASTITANFGGSTNTSVGAACFRAANTADPLDVHNQTAQGTSATSATTTNTGALAIAREAVMGVVGSPTSLGTTACNGSYTRSVNLTTTPGLLVCTMTVNATSSVAFSPSWTNAVNYVADLVSFKGFPPTLGAMGTGY